jgi:hypothetical protein
MRPRGVFTMIGLLVGLLLVMTTQRTFGAEDLVRDVAGRIDRALEAEWKANGITPADPATDAEFFRRVNLDLTGCIPGSADVTAFLADRDPEKRRRWAEQLLNSPRYIRHQTNRWRDLLLPPTNGPQVQRWRLELEGWLREQFRKDVPYDRMVRELLTTPVAVDLAAAGGFPDQASDPRPLSFYRVADFKADNLAAGSARIFLGINLECAQCHDHPFAPWTRRDFAGFAAFFAGVRPTRWQAGRVVAAVEKSDERSFALPGAAPVAARFLDGTPPRWPEGASGRSVLADWIVAPNNPYFARHGVNQIWGQLFGAPLTDQETGPLKDLLDDLARTFAARGYPPGLLLRAIIASRAYQLSSAAPSGEPGRPPRLFDRMRTRGLSADQLFDSIVRSAGLPETADATFRPDFLNRFNQPGEQPADRQTSILQTLTLMNGQFLATATDPERSPLLASVAEAPWLDTAGQVEALYLATYSRPPRPEERTRLVAFVERSRPSDRRRSLADVFWALLNSSEFLFDH